MPAHSEMYVGIDHHPTSKNIGLAGKNYTIEKVHANVVTVTDWLVGFF